MALAASHVGLNGSPWPAVPGLVLAGAGLALLVIPLVNVVLAAVPVEAAGGASGQLPLPLRVWPGQDGWRACRRRR